MLWSDETNNESFCQVQHRHVWRRNRDAYKEKHLIPTVKYDGGSLMFWGCFNSRGPGALVRIDGIMNSTKYQATFESKINAFEHKKPFHFGDIFPIWSGFLMVCRWCHFLCIWGIL